MGILSSFIAGFLLNVRAPTGWILKWLANLMVAILLTWPLSERVPAWLDSARLQSPELIWNQFWLQQAGFLSGFMPYLIMLGIVIAVFNAFVSGGALSQFAAVVAKERRPFWQGGLFLLPALLLHTALVGVLVGLWLWYWLPAEYVEMVAFFDPSKLSFWLFGLGLALLAYIYEVIRVQIALEGERQVRQGAGADVGAALIRAPLLWSIGTLQGLISLFAKPGLLLIWLVLIGVDGLVYSVTSQMGEVASGQATIFVSVQLVMLFRILLDLAFLGAGTQYLGKKSEKATEDI